ncbi:MAG: DUF1858 domain-containing protein [Planctomycetota bacterium]|jgi:hypothetical protein
MAQDLPILPTTKVDALLTHYPELEDVLIDMAPPFKKLRNPILRKSVAKVASLRQAAAVARVPVEEVINKLRRAVGQECTTVDGVDAAADYFASQPAWFDPSRIVASIDERESGAPDEMTLNRVWRRARELRESEILELVTTFLPAPGIDVVKAQGFQAWSVEEDSGVIRTYFTKSGGEEADPRLVRGPRP